MNNKKCTRSVSEINAEIMRAKKQLENISGTTREAYARIVGYYRSVRNWNKGKREEYNERLTFNAAYPKHDDTIKLN